MEAVEQDRLRPRPPATDDSADDSTLSAAYIYRASKKYRAFEKMTAI
jgi:hypothetical protein